MVEINCPNCGARYEVPEEALGASGRRVTCSACRHVWTAQPPAAAADPGQAQRQSRGRQMAEIRQMLGEVQQAEARRAGPEARAVPPAPEEPPARRGAARRDTVPEDEGDPEAVEETEQFLRDRVGLSGQSGRVRQAREHGRTSGDRRKLMRRHRRKTLEKQVREKRGSGAGLTGFLLVVLVAATLTGLYVLHPQIIARAPSTEPALRDYVAAVDGLRGDIAAATADIREKVAAEIEARRQEEGDG